MAKMKVEGLDGYSRMLESLGASAVGIMKHAVYEGAAEGRRAIADAIQALPEDRPRRLNLSAGEKYNGATPDEKAGLIRHLGYAHIDENGMTVSARVGFDGYLEDHPTKKYPRGVPAALLARSIESGSSVRRKNPVIRKAVRASQARIEAAMERAADELIEKITKA